MDNPNRYRISSKFPLLKIVSGIGFLAFLVSLIKEFNNESLSPKNIAGFFFVLLFLAALIYYLNTRKIIEYDDVKLVLYVSDYKGQFQTEIPVERIDEISLSAVGIKNGERSYIIGYRDFNNQAQKLRLFPIFNSSIIDVLIEDTKYKNPQVVVNRWSI